MQKTNIGINNRANILAVFTFTILGTSNLTELTSVFLAALFPLFCSFQAILNENISHLLVFFSI